MTPKEARYVDLFTSVIKSSEYVRFMYDGKERVVETYLVGELWRLGLGQFDEGELAIRCYFISGETSQIIHTPFDRWRIFKLKRIINPEILESKSETLKKGYHVNDKDFHKIIYQYIPKQD